MSENTFTDRLNKSIDLQAHINRELRPVNIALQTKVRDAEAKIYYSSDGWTVIVPRLDLESFLYVTEFEEAITTMEEEDFIQYLRKNSI